jgi:hypothetical protein
MAKIFKIRSAGADVYPHPVARPLSSSLADFSSVGRGGYRRIGSVGLEKRRYFQSQPIYAPPVSAKPTARTRGLSPAPGRGHSLHSGHGSSRQAPRLQAGTEEQERRERGGGNISAGGFASGPHQRLFSATETLLHILGLMR